MMISVKQGMLGVRRAWLAVATAAVAMTVALTVTTVSASAQVAGANTGDNLPGGVNDPYWTQFNGIASYGTPGALTKKGDPANVFTMSDYRPWVKRSVHPEGNFNLGWISTTDWKDQTDSAGPQPATMRLFIDLTGYNLKKYHIAGRFFADDYVGDIYVNGKEIANFPGRWEVMSNQSWLEGDAFDIVPKDGLVAGINVLDFVYRYQYSTGPFDGIRVDFVSIFRETPDR